MIIVTRSVQTDSRDLTAALSDGDRSKNSNWRYFSEVRYPVLTRSAASLISDLDGLYDDDHFVDDTLKSFHIAVQFEERISETPEVLIVDC